MYFSVNYYTLDKLQSHCNWSQAYANLTYRYLFTGVGDLNPRSAKEVDCSEKGKP